MFIIKKRYILLVRALLLSALLLRVHYSYGSFERGFLAVISIISTHSWSIVLFLGFYIIRPFVLIPVGRLSMLAGSMRGRRPGTLIALVGEFISACIAFAVGRHFGRDRLSEKQQISFSFFAFNVELSPFWAVALSRISPLPDDVINYGRGIVRLDRQPYILGSIAGNSIFSVINVGLGEQIQLDKVIQHGFRHGIHRPDLVGLLIIYGLLLLASIAIIKYFKKQKN